MVIKMNSLSQIALTILIAFVSVFGYTTYKIQKNHEQRIIEVVEKRIVEGALDCFFLDECQGNKVTLKELIKKGFANKEINPKTKTYYSVDSYVLKENGTYHFYAN